MTTNLPAAFQARYFKESQSAEQPTIVRDENNVLQIPVFVRAEEIDGETVYKFYNVPVRFTGQDYSNYEKCVLQSYGEIRKFFYGTPDQQSEMRDDATWEGHRQAIRSAFPKNSGDVNPSAVRFKAIYDMFWDTIDDACEAVGKTRSDLPSYFTAEQMLAFAVANGMTDADVEKYTQTFATISLDLLHNSRNWKELFL